MYEVNVFQYDIFFKQVPITV